MTWTVPSIISLSKPSITSLLTLASLSSKMPLMMNIKTSLSYEDGGRNNTIQELNRHANGAYNYINESISRFKQRSESRYKINGKDCREVGYLIHTPKISAGNISNWGYGRLLPPPQQPPIHLFTPHQMTYVCNTYHTGHYPCAYNTARYDAKNDQPLISIHTTVLY